MTIKWVPGNRGVEGNETAGELARQGSRTNPMGPATVEGITKACAKGEVRKWLFDILQLDSVPRVSTKDQ